MVSKQRPISQGLIEGPSEAEMAANELISPTNMHRDLTIGTAQEVIDQIKRYEDLGYDEYSFWIDSGMEFSRKRNSLSRFINDVMPAFNCGPKMTKLPHFQMFIDGAWSEGHAGQVMTMQNPATGKD